MADVDNKGKDSHTWHAQTPEEVCAALKTSREGLSADEVERRRAQHGRNTFTKQKQPGIVAHTFGQLKSPFALVLIAAFCITMVLGEYVDAAVVSFALVIAVAVGVLQEGRASRAFMTLAKSQHHRTTVVREGARHEIDAELVVVGDVVELESGAQVPADLRLLTTKKLSINEAALTGEWLAVEKHERSVAIGAPFVEKESMAWMGTYVATGTGVGVVVAVGDQTAVGKLARDLGTITDSKTPLQREMGHIAQIMLGVIMMLVAAIFILGVISGESLETMLITSIAVAVASIPEGLPAAVTIVLAVAMESLLRRGGLVRNLLAAETLGSTTYVLTDKTGTLTRARMALSRVVVAPTGATAVVERDNWETHAVVREVFDFALCASDAYLEKSESEETFVVKGEPMERAMLEAAHSIGVSTEGESARARRFDYLAFSSENRFAAGLTKQKERTVLCVNGAPEDLLVGATHVHTNDGSQPLTPALRRAFADQIEQQTSTGARLMAVAYKVYTEETIDETQVVEGTVLMGLLVFHDPVREGVKASIEGVRRAGARVVLVTGDNPNTARSVACAVGIVSHDAAVLTGTDIEAMDDQELICSLREVSVFARVLPHEKMRLATVLQERGEVVAMTGDGVNDASALRKADIGISIGSGTEVAKEASDLVLVNDSFSIVYAAIEEGRRVVSNLRKIVGYLLSTSFSEVILIATALLIGAPVPLVPAQILWANLVEEGLMSVAFAFEPGEKRAMERKPQNIRDEGVLSRTMLTFIALVVTIMGGLLIALYFYLRSLGAPIEEIRSVMFVAVSIDSLFIAFSFRSLSTPLWHISLKSNLFFLGSFVVSLGLLLVVLTVPFFQFVLSYEPIPLLDMALIIGYGFLTLVAIESAKWVFFERR